MSDSISTTRNNSATMNIVKPILLQTPLSTKPIHTFNLTVIPLKRARFGISIDSETFLETHV